ncbi:hypothetical protein SAMN02745751_02359 [Dethiosulfatibacter aminovorans DSM 17477]|uniref:DUF5050 domain-containing protein n=1 Tax=Dethiosulfatibacter aminovorans DSM 17477 TaxID=1121476 RepID=A0A1M6IJX4_9FIRM|nr:hypothetical protein [Dethiosulfatibacter aminovorans]SHJ34756.1 hypothetical protein SAMN02745751_02359 [Dethiosulfatibacter aminovorans DSM 17477]
MKKTKLTVLLPIILIICLLSVGCGAASGGSTTIAEETILDEIFIFKSNGPGSSTGDLYFIDGDKEKIKIDSDVLNSTFQVTPEDKKILYVTEDNTLYLKETDKEKEKITSDVYPYSARFSADESTIVFEKADYDSYDLYVKKIGQDKEKIASDTEYFDLSWDGNSVFYIDSEDNLYIKNHDQDKEKIASDVSFIYPCSDGETILYINNDDNFYYKNIVEDEKVKLSSEPVEQYYNIFVSDDSEMITYLDEYDYLKSRGELYSYEVGEEPQKLASDVSSHYMSRNGKYVYYLNDEEELYAIDIKSDEKEKIATDVVSIITSHNGTSIAYLDTDDILYVKETGKEKEKLATDVLKWDLTGDGAVILNNDNELYIKRNRSEEKEHLADSIEDFLVVSNGTCLYYYNDNDELYVIEKDQEPRMIMDGLDKNENVHIQNSLFMQTKLSLEDISGIWKNDYYDEIITISDDGTVSVDSFEYGAYEGQMMNVEPFSDSISATIFDEEYTFSVNDENSIRIDYDDYYRIDEDEYREWQDEQMKYTLLYEVVFITGDNVTCYANHDAGSEYMGFYSYGDELYVEDVYKDDSGAFWLMGSFYDDYWNYTEIWLPFDSELMFIE